jgi:hypothetical protein
VNCDEANNLVNAGIDGELSADDAARLDAHVGTCADCRAISVELAAVDAELDRAFAARRDATAALASRVIAAFNAESAAKGNGWAVRERARGRIRMPAQPMKPPSFWANWGRPLIAAAAGFLLAIGITRPWDRPVAPVAGRVEPATHPMTAAAPMPASRPVAQLALASGAVFTCPAGSDDWRRLETGGAVAAGSQVRTGPKVFCEFKMDDGSEVRLNAATHVTLAAARRVDVASGQVYSTVRKAAGAFVVRAIPADTTLTALGTAFDVRCDTGRDATLTVVEGSVRVESAGGQSDVVKGGESLV